MKDQGRETGVAAETGFKLAKSRLDLVPRDIRLPVALRCLDQRGHIPAVLPDLLRDARAAGLRIGHIYLDWEFHGYEPLRFLAGPRLPVIPRLRLNCRPRKRWKHGQRSYVTEHFLMDAKGRGAPLRRRIHVVVRYQVGERFGKHVRQYLICAVFGGLTPTTGNRSPAEDPRPLPPTDRDREFVSGGREGAPENLRPEWPVAAALPRRGSETRERVGHP